MIMTETDAGGTLWHFVLLKVIRLAHAQTRALPSRADSNHKRIGIFNLSCLVRELLSGLPGEVSVGFLPFLAKFSRLQPQTIVARSALGGRAASSFETAKRCSFLTPAVGKQR